MIQQKGRDAVHTIESNTHCSDKSKGQEKRAVAKIHDEDIEGWGTIILSIFIGLLALWFFLAVGGIVAIMGACMILAVRHLVQQKWVRKAARRLWLQVSKLVVSVWIDTSTWRDLPHDELYAHEAKIVVAVKTYAPASSSV